MSSKSHVRNTKWKKILFYAAVWLLRVTWLFEPPSTLLFIPSCTFRQCGGLRAFCQVDITPACRLSCVLWMLSSKAGAVFFKMRWRGWQIQFLSFFFPLFFLQQAAQSFCFVLKFQKTLTFVLDVNMWKMLFVRIIKADMKQVAPLITKLVTLMFLKLKAMSAVNISL